MHPLNAGDSTRQEYVAEISRLEGRKTWVEGVDSGSFPRSAPVPGDERLISLKITKLRNWREALREYLEVGGQKGLEVEGLRS